jgi:hypothetical protein
MRQFGIVLALAVLVAASPVAAAAEGPSGPAAPAAVLGPELLGFDAPGQGFYPRFPAFPGFSGGNIFGGGGGGWGLPGNGGCPSIGYVYCPVLGASPYWATFPSAGFSLGSSAFGQFGLGGFGWPGAGAAFWR